MPSTILQISPSTDTEVKKRARVRVASIDLLRGAVMIIMALDHVRDYFHRDAFLYDPTDLSRTSILLFFTRWITNFCAPVFVMLAGVSASLYGGKKTRKQLSFFLFSRGLWLVFAEFFIITLEWTFNPSYPMLYMQVIWATGISMMVLSALVFLRRRTILVIGLVLIAGHNLLDNVHVTGNGAGAVIWQILHEPGERQAGPFTFIIRYPLLPWIGLIATGYCIGAWYALGYEASRRKRRLLFTGVGALILFEILRAGNFYGDAAYWSIQQNSFYDLLSFLKVTKYPPSLLYILVTIGPALIFLALTEGPQGVWKTQVQAWKARLHSLKAQLHVWKVQVSGSKEVLDEWEEALHASAEPRFGWKEAPTAEARKESWDQWKEPVNGQQDPLRLREKREGAIVISAKGKKNQEMVKMAEDAATALRNKLHATQETGKQRWGLWKERVTIFGRVPMFYYLAHIFLIHFVAVFGVMISGRPWTDMILANRVNKVAALKGYGFDLPVVYLVWIGVVLSLYPLCKWFDRYKRANVARYWWLSYL